MLIVGEYFSQGDAENGRPFSDGLGKMFKQFLRQTGIDPRECKFLNVVNRPTSTYKSLVGPKEVGQPGVKFVKRGEYLRADHWDDVVLLRKTINSLRPNLVLALGDLALWALTDETSVKNSRGRITPGNSTIPGIKVLPTYSPRNIAQEYSLRPVLLADLAKAKREDEFPEIRRPQRFIHLHPSIEDLENFLNQYIVPSPALSVDIETKGTMITCVGVSPSPNRAMVVPFFSESHKDGNYWRTQREEYIAWRWVARVLSLADKVTFGQNFQYDVQHLWRTMGIPAVNFGEDTMLAHHSLFIELQKGLGFLGSIYTDELSWKFMHKTKSNDRSAKKGDVE